MTAVIPVQFMTKRPLQQITTDTQVGNCALWLPADARISGNAVFDMPNAYPTTWGVTGSFWWGNLYAYHFPQSPVDYGIAQINVRNYSTVSTPVLGGVQQTNRNFNNCNCNGAAGAGGFNCYSNCNCNCACACDCSNCNCDCGK